MTQPPYNEQPPPDPGPPPVRTILPLNPYGAGNTGYQQPVYGQPPYGQQPPYGYQTDTQPGLGQQPQSGPDYTYGGNTGQLALPPAPAPVPLPPAPAEKPPLVPLTDPDQTTVRTTPSFEPVLRQRNRRLTRLIGFKHSKHLYSGLALLMVAGMVVEGVNIEHDRSEAAKAPCPPPTAAVFTTEPFAKVLIQGQTTITFPITALDGKKNNAVADNAKNKPRVYDNYSADATIEPVANSNARIAVCTRKIDGQAIMTVNRAALQLYINPSVDLPDLDKKCQDKDHSNEYKCVDGFKAAEGLKPSNLVSAAEANRVNSWVEEGGKNHSAYVAAANSMSDDAILASLTDTPSSQQLTAAADARLMAEAKTLADQSKIKKSEITFSGDYLSPQQALDAKGLIKASAFTINLLGTPSFTITRI